MKVAPKVQLLLRPFRILNKEYYRFRALINKENYDTVELAYSCRKII
jgi:hypothetical protein